jgi:hypothetical protein
MMDNDTLPPVLSEAADLVKRQRAHVVALAKAKRFEELPAAHQVLRRMEDALKLARLRCTAAN